MSYRGSVISACIGLRGLLGVKQGEFVCFFHHIRYETEWSFLNHKKENKNLRLKDTCTFVIEKLRIKHGFGLIMDEFHNFRYEHLWNHDFFAQELNIIITQTSPYVLYPKFHPFI